MSEPKGGSTEPPKPPLDPPQHRQQHQQTQEEGSPLTTLNFKLNLGFFYLCTEHLYIKKYSNVNFPLD